MRHCRRAASDLVAGSGVAALGVAALGALAAAGPAACGGAGRSAPTAVTVPVAAGSVPATTFSPATAPAGAQLAIGTAEGMEVWSASTGVFTATPVGRNVVTSELAWSADGRYLSWQTVPAGGGRHGDELWYASVPTGVTRHWGPLPPGRTYGPVVVTDSGVITLGRVITRYAAAQATTVGVLAGPDPAGSGVASWPHGWVVGPAGSPGRQVRRVTAAGALLGSASVFAGPPPGGRRFDLDAVGADGREAAAELGRHRTGCELSGVAQLWTVSLAGGTPRLSTPPAAVARDTQRFWAIDVSGPAGSVYASSFDCAVGGKARGRVTATVLWDFRGGGGAMAPRRSPSRRRRPAGRWTSGHPGRRHPGRPGGRRGDRWGSGPHRRPGRRHWRAGHRVDARRRCAGVRPAFPAPPSSGPLRSPA